MTHPHPQSESTVNESLTANRLPEKPSRMVENHDYAAMLGRMVRSYAKRLAAGDVEDLADALGLVDQMNEAIRAAVRALRDEQGYSWAELAAPLGISRQAAQQRWGRP